MLALCALILYCLPRSAGWTPAVVSLVLMVLSSRFSVDLWAAVPFSGMVAFVGGRDSSAFSGALVLTTAVDIIYRRGRGSDGVKTYLLLAPLFLRGFEPATEAMSTATTILI